MSEEKQKSEQQPEQHVKKLIKFETKYHNFPCTIIINKERDRVICYLKWGNKNKPKDVYKVRAIMYCKDGDVFDMDWGIRTAKKKAYMKLAEKLFNYSKRIESEQKKKFIKAKIEYEDLLYKKYPIKQIESQKEIISTRRAEKEKEYKKNVIIDEINIIRKSK